jgi:hypothetical protein
MAPSKFPDIGRQPRPWLKLLIAAAVAAAAAYAGIELPRAPGAEPPAVRVPLPLTSSSAPPSVLRLQHGNSACSATVIASENGYCLALSCAHCFGGAPGGERRPACRLVSLNDGAAFNAVGIAGDDLADCALVLFKGNVPAAPVNGTLPPVGTAVEHFGITSGHATGKMLPLPNLVRPAPTDLFRSSCSSIPGDSGAGVFAAGKLVAWNWGYYVERPPIQGGTPIAFAVDAAVRSPEVRKLFPKQCAEWGAPKEPPPPVEPPPVVEPPAPPGDVCPPLSRPYDRRGPVRRFLFPRR